MTQLYNLVITGLSLSAPNYTEPPKIQYAVSTKEYTLYECQNEIKKTQKSIGKPKWDTSNFCWPVGKQIQNK